MLSAPPDQTGAPAPIPQAAPQEPTANIYATPAQPAPAQPAPAQPAAAAHTSDIQELLSLSHPEPVYAEPTTQHPHSDAEGGKHIMTSLWRH